MQINQHLNFPGTCQEAFTRYAEVLGGEITSMIPHAGTPAEEHVPAEWHDKIMHATLEAGGTVIMGVDLPPDFYEKPQGSAVAIQVDEAEEGERLFTALAEGGTVVMPYEETFWAYGFGMCTDRFGIPWMINAGNKM